MAYEYKLLSLHGRSFLNGWNLNAKSFLRGRSASGAPAAPSRFLFSQKSTTTLNCVRILFVRLTSAPSPLCISGVPLDVAALHLSIGSFTFHGTAADSCFSFQRSDWTENVHWRLLSLITYPQRFLSRARFVPSAFSAVPHLVLQNCAFVRLIPPPKITKALLTAQRPVQR